MNGGACGAICAIVVFGFMLTCTVAGDRAEHSTTCKYEMRTAKTAVDTLAVMRKYDCDDPTPHTHRVNP